MAKSSIKIAAHDLETLRREAKLTKRSISGQASYWMAIGKAVEHSGIFDVANVRKALSRQVSPDVLTGPEQEVFVDELLEAARVQTPEQEALFEDRRKRGIGVGLDRDGEIVQESGEADT